MDRNTIDAIFRQIVIDMAYERGLQVNSFVSIDSDPQINHESFGQTYDDYLRGKFWSRAWAQGGAGRNNIQGDFPVLFTESRRIHADLNNSNDIIIELYLLLVDKIPCPMCPPDMVRTGEVVSSNVLAMFRAILKELKGYRLCQVEKDGVSSWQWLSKGRLEYMLSDGYQLIQTERDMIAHIDTDVSFSEWGRMSDYRAYYTKLNFHLCWSVDASFNYNNPTVDQLVSTQCPC